MKSNLKYKRFNARNKIYVKYNDISSINIMYKPDKLYIYLMILNIKKSILQYIIYHVLNKH